MAEARTEQSKMTDTLTYVWGHRLNSMILLVHAVLLLVFFLSGATAMAVVNCFSVTCYFIEYSVLKRNPTVFLWIFFAEVLIHATLAVYFVGWDCGFQFYPFAMVSILFYCDHTLRRDGFASIYPLVVSGISVAAFFLEDEIGKNLTPVYSLQPQVVQSLNSANGVMILAMVALFSKVYIDRILFIESELTQNAEFDELTGLPNRHRLDRILDEQQIGKGDLLDRLVLVFKLGADEFRVHHRDGAGVIEIVKEELVIVEGGDDACRIGHARGFYQHPGKGRQPPEARFCQRRA